MEKQSSVIEEPETVILSTPIASQSVATETNQPAQVTPTATPPVASPPALPSIPIAAPIKAKRIPPEKQKLNYLAANARRVQILADAKRIREAEASEKAREKAACEEFKLAIQLASKYGFVPGSNQIPQTPSTSQSHQLPHQQPTQPEVDHIPPIQYYERPPITLRYV
ncbi:hypothetical protein T492DRAFT_839271 [Pavlovales sp. CCMP2436]|nr:hypothetical protein T492DRAFT_839271 [Pavlovales sp. CCMP2436]